MTLPCFLADASSLALVAEKTNAHTDTDIFGDAGVTSVHYSPDGTKVVSSGRGGTIKVWGERPFLTAMHPTAT